MTDKVYPTAKPTTNATVNAAAPANPSFPATKSQLYGATRPTYRPQSHHHRRSRRRLCCTICFWIILIILILLLLIGVASTVVYLLYRPHLPSFTVTAIKLSHFNLTHSSLNSKFDVNVTATNPNKRITFSYDPTTVSIFSGKLDVGDGTVPGFKHREKNTTMLKVSILRSGVVLDGENEAKLKSSMNSKSGLPLKVQLATKVKANVGKMKTPYVRIRVVCDRIRITLPVGKKPTVGSTSNAKCDVAVRFKIWKWTIG